MASLFVALPAPAGNASGAAVDVSAFGATKTVTVEESGTAFVTIEVSNDAGHVKWAPLWTFRGGGERTFAVACRFMRATVGNFRDGAAPVVEVGGTDDGTLFATLLSPASDGVGASVDVSALGLYKTVQVSNKFRGAINIEVSEDGGATFSQAFSFRNAGIQSALIAADFMRVTRAGTPFMNPGAPIVNIGATSSAGGGGGGGSVVTDNVTIRGDGGIANPIALIGGKTQTGQLTTNGNGIEIESFSGTLITPAVRSFHGDPNTIVPGDKGSLLLDDTVPALWQNTDGATAWSKVGGGGGAFFDTILPTVLFHTGGGTVYNDVNAGKLGQNTLIPFNSSGDSNSVMTGLSDNGNPPTDGQIVGWMPDSPNAVANLFRIGNDELSVPANRYWTPQAADFDMQNQVIVLIRYNGAAQRWMFMGGT